MSLQVKGRIVKILDVESGVSKADKEWKKQNFVIDTGSQYNPEVCFQVFGDEKIAMLGNFGEGQEVEVAFNISSREFNGKYYHNIDAWKIDPIGQATPVNPLPPVGSNDSDADDDLPF